MRRYQFTLRSLLMATVVVSIFASLTAWIMRQPPSRYSAWENTVNEASAERPGFVVGTKSIHDWEPTVGYFVRFDRYDNLEQRRIKWLKHEGWQARVNGSAIPHRYGEFQLFVDDGSGCPTRVSLDAEDARKYFGRKNRVFVDYESCAKFWDEVLVDKYLVKGELGSGRTGVGANWGRGELGSGRD